MSARDPSSVPDVLRRRTPLGALPTPFSSMSRIERSYDGVRLWIKRDDLTGLAFGGNKTRKLEYLVADALDRGCDTLITGGAAQSNHCRQTAAAAATQGLGCHLVLGGQAPTERDGNLLLDHLFGATVHWAGERRKGEDIPAIAETLRQSGAKPYVVPYGGSDVIGGLGYVKAMLELKEQLAEGQTYVSHIVVASSSGGTQAGLLCGARMAGLDCEIIGIGIDANNRACGDYVNDIQALSNAMLRSLGKRESVTAACVQVEDRFLGDGYGVVGALERDAILRLARSEGILLDPVYTARAFAAFMVLLDEGRFSATDSIVFWHTGGQVALFPYRSAFSDAR